MERNKINSKWNDLPLKKRDQNQLIEMEAHLHNSKKNYIALFSGESRTGKTMAAEILGKSTNRKVYTFHLSQLISEYIGETEKNMEKIFSDAINSNGILFFDEADALFGRRSKVKDAHDKYSSIKRFIINYPGLIVLSVDKEDKISGMKFDSIIEFKEQSYLEQKLLELKNYFRGFISKLLPKGHHSNRRHR